MEVPRLDNIKVFREKVGWTQKQLADETGVGQSYIAKIESGKQNPSYDVVQQIFEKLREQLLKLEKNPMVVKNVATRMEDLKWLTPMETIQDIKMKMGDFDQIPVIDNGRCVGVITSQLLIRVLSQGYENGTSVKEIMDPPLPSFSENTLIKQMREILRFIDAALIVNEKQITGIVTRTDVFNAF